MKALSILLFTCFAGWSQTAPPSAAWDAVPDATVIAVFGDGASMTMGDFKNLFHALPPEIQQRAQNQPGAFLQNWALMLDLAKYAKAQKLDERSPTRESLEFSDTYILMQAAMQEALRRTTVDPAEAHQYFDAHKDKYKEVRLKAIYISFSEQSAAASSSASSSSVKPRTEEEAKALAAKLVAQLRGGTDFVKMVAQYSDDAASKAKDGDFTTVHGSDNIPDAIKTPILAMKAGDISDPIRQPNTIYIFRAESVSYKTFDDASEEIFNQLKMDHYRQWMDKMNKDAKVDIKNPAFLGSAPAGGKDPGAH